MMIQKIQTFILMSVLLFSTHPAFSADKKENPYYTPSYVKQNKMPSGIFETEGYVTFIHQIKGCSTPDSVCPPGSDTSIIIVHEQKNGPENTAIRIKITKDTKGLQKGQRYRFTVKAGSGTLSAQSKLQFLELVNFTPIK